MSVSENRVGIWRWVKRAIRATALRCGYYIGRCGESDRPETPASVLSSMLSILSINCVLDVGAHRGEYADSLRDCLRQLPLIAILRGMNRCPSTLPSFPSAARRTTSGAATHSR